MRKIAYIFIWIFVASIPLQEFAASELVEVSGTLSRLFGIAATLVAFAALIYDARLRPFAPVHGFIVLLLAWGCLTYLWSVEPAATFGRIITNVQLLVMVLMFAQFASREDESTGLLTAYVVGALISLLELFRRYAMGSALRATMWHERYTAFENNPNDYALALGIAIPMGWYLASRRISIYTTLLGYAYTGLGFLGVLMTGSRGGFMAAIVGSMIIPVSMLRLGRRERIAAVVVVLVGLAVAVRYTPDKAWARLSTLEEVTEAGSASELDGVNIRTVIWRQGIIEFVTNPQAAAIGVGTGAFRHGVEPVFGERLVAHNVYISILVEQGLIGMSLFLIVMYMLATSLRYLPRAERYLWFFVFACWGLGVMFVTWEHTKNTWFIIGLLAARGLSARYAIHSRPGLLASLFRRTRIGWRLQRPVY